MSRNLVLRTAGAECPICGAWYDDLEIQWDQDGVYVVLDTIPCRLCGIQLCSLCGQFACDACAHVYFPPRPFCPACACRKVSIFKASGKGKLYSYVIHHRPVPGFTPPYAIAVVELDEGPRMMSNIVDCPQTPEALELDMKLEVAFEKLDDKITLPLFRPTKG